MPEELWMGVRDIIQVEVIKTIPKKKKCKKAKWLSEEALQIAEKRKEAKGKGGSPLQYSCLENPSDRGAWQATVRRVAEDLDMTEAA